jgi:hypothetical protein
MAALSTEPRLRDFSDPDERSAWMPLGVRYEGREGAFAGGGGVDRLRADFLLVEDTRGG